MSHSFAPRAQKLVRKLCLELLKSSKKSAARICRYAARYAAAWSANVLDASLSGSTARVWNNGTVYIAKNLTQKSEISSHSVFMITYIQTSYIVLALSTGESRVSVFKRICRSAYYCI